MNFRTGRQTEAALRMHTDQAQHQWQSFRQSEFKQWRRFRNRCAACAIQHHALATGQVAKLWPQLLQMMQTEPACTHCNSSRPISSAMEKVNAAAPVKIILSFLFCLKHDYSTSESPIQTSAGPLAPHLAGNSSIHTSTFCPSGITSYQLKTQPHSLCLQVYYSTK